MPVPSTITGLRLTIVLMPCGRVASAQPFIMIGGPIATHSSMSGCFAIASADAFGDHALDARPSRRRCRRSARRRRRGTCRPRTSRSLLRKPMTPITYAPASCNARACGKVGATPSPPPTHSTFFACADRTRDAHRPDHRVQRGADRQLCCISFVVLPTAWITSVIVPRSAVEVGDRQRNALAVLGLHHDDELAGLRGLRHQRVAHLEQVGDGREILARNDFEMDMAILQTRRARTALTANDEAQGGREGTEAGAAPRAQCTRTKRRATAEGAVRDVRAVCQKHDNSSWRRRLARSLRRSCGASMRADSTWNDATGGHPPRRRRDLIFVSDSALIAARLAAGGSGCGARPH